MNRVSFFKKRLTSSGRFLLVLMLILACSFSYIKIASAKEIIIGTGTDAIGVGGNSNPTYKLNVAGSINSTGLCLSGDCKATWGDIVASGGGNQWTTLGANIYNSNSGNVGIGTTNPLANLDVAGKTVKFSNLKPIYQLTYGGGTAASASWVKIADVVLGSGLYVGANFKVTILDSMNNAGHSVNAASLTYYVRMTRSTGTQDSPNNAQVSGPSVDYVRVVQTATGSYELQVNQPGDWRYITVSAQAYSINSLGAGGSINYVNTPTSGSTSGTIYTATAVSTDYFSNIFTLGNVGIGTTAATYKLDVAGTAQFNNSVIVGTPTATNHATTKSYVDSIATSLTGGGVGTGTTGQTLRHNGTSWVANSTLYNNGTNIGIGTTIPSVSLHVNSNTGLRISRASNPDQYMTLLGGDGSGVASITSFYNLKFMGGASPTYGYFQFSNSSGDLMRITQTGSVGIGTTNPQAKLEVSGNIRIPSATGAIINEQNREIFRTGWSNNLGATGLDVEDYTVMNSGYDWTGGEPSSLMTSYTYPLLVMRGNSGVAYNSVLMALTNAGNLGIGSTVPAYKLDVAGTAQFNNAVIVGTPTAANHAVTKSYLDSALGNPVGSGTTGQTLRHNGTSWVANSVLYNNGTNVGVGTTNPLNKLQIMGNVGIQTAYSNGLLNFQGDSTTTLISTTRSDNTIPGNLAFDGWGNYMFSNKLGVGTNISLSGSTATLYVNGNVGVGTTNPTAKLTIGDFNSDHGHLELRSGNYQWGWAFDTYDYGGGNVPLKIWQKQGNAYAEVMRIAQGGNVGIGTINPTTSLYVNGTGYFSQPVVVGIPTASNHAATKSYVDSAITSGNATLLDNIDSPRFIYGQNGSGSNSASTTQNVFELAQYKSGFWDTNASTWAPTTDWYWGATFAHTSNSTGYNYSGQLAFRNGGGGNYVYARTISGGTPTVWSRLLSDASDVNSSGNLRITGSGNHYISSGNLGIGSTIPAYKLDVAGTAQFNNAVIVGTPTAANHATTKSYVDSAAMSAANSFWAANGANIYSANSGNVGIGTNNPGSKLHVTGKTQITDGIAGADTVDYSTFGVTREASSSPLSYIAMTRSGAAVKAMGIDSGNNWLFGAPTASTQIISNPWLVITPSGNTGVGATSPLSKLSVGGNGNANYALNVTATSQQYGTYSSASTYGVYGSGGTYGISGSGGTAGVRASGGGYGVHATGVYGVLSNGSSYDFYGENAAGKSYFAGNVGIGSSTPALKLVVDGAAQFNNSVIVGTPTATNHAVTKSYLDSAISSVGNITNIQSLGNGLNAEINREIKKPGVYTYSTYSGGTGGPSTYNQILTWGSGNSAIQIGGDWLQSSYTPLYVRSLRDSINNWTPWTRILTNYIDHYAANMDQYVSTTASPSFYAGSFSQAITVGSPTIASHATTKSYVDSAIAASGIGVGTANQTLRHNGTSWVASSLLYNNGSSISIGTTNANAKLVVQGTDDASNSGVVDITTNGGTSLKIGGNTTYSWIQSHAGKPLYINQLGNNVVLNLAGGNVGIGTNNLFSKLQVAGDIATDVGNRISPVASDMGAAYLKYDETSIPDARFVLNGYYGLRFDTAGGTRMVVKSDGNIGIGTNSPAAKLDINYQGVFNAVTPGKTTYGLHFNGQTTSDYATGITWNGGDSGAQAGLYVQGSSSYGTKMYFATTQAYVTGAQTRMMIDHVGNIGVGTTNPIAKVHILKNSDIGNENSGGISITSTGSNNNAKLIIGAVGDSYSYIQSMQSNTSWYSRPLVLQPNTTSRVGIGTTNPATSLEVTGTDSGTTPGNTTSAIRITNTATAYLATTELQFASVPGKKTAAMGSILLDGSGNSVGDLFFATRNSAADTNLTERMRILYNGNVGIGTTNPTYKLYVAGVTYSSGNIITSGQVQANGGTNYGSNSGYSFYGSGGDTDGGMFSPADGTVVFATNNVERLRINSSGAVSIGTTNPDIYKLYINGAARATSFAYESDRSLKKNIATISDPLAKIMELRGVTFNWKKTNNPSVGLIAQEVETVFPELVSESNGIKTVEYGNLVAPLIEAVKAQQQEIESLNERLKALEAKK